MTKTSVLLAATALLVLAGAAAAAIPDQPTFHRDVEPILQANCQNCHRSKPIDISGMVAPFALTSYEEARPWAKSVARAVSAKEMPPWFATEEFHGVFENERSLTEDEIATIVRWANTGATKGDAADAPAPLEFRDSKWWLGQPDLIIKLPEPLWVGDDVVDWQPSVYIEITEDMLPKDRFLKAIECRPGSEWVHHVVINDMAPSGSGDELSEIAGKLIGGLAPGSEPALHPEGFGTLLRTGAKLRVNMHYNKEAGEGTGFWDQTEMGFFFYPEGAVVREVQNAPIGLLDFEIPPLESDWVVGMARTFDRPFSVLSLLPHMHVRGVAATFEAFYPDGRQEVLLDVPEYDYNWQVDYQYPEPRHFPAGTRIEVTMTFDNSTENESNPDPNKAISFGLLTQDEMALGFMQWSWDDEEMPGATGGGGQ